MICVIEIKVDYEDAGNTSEIVAAATDGTNSELEQIRARNYAEKYLSEPGKRVFEVSVVFDRTERNLSSFAWVERTD